MVNIMPSKPPVIFLQKQRLLRALGERIRLARLTLRFHWVAQFCRTGAMPPCSAASAVPTSN